MQVGKTSPWVRHAVARLLLVLLPACGGLAVAQAARIPDDGAQPPAAGAGLRVFVPFNAGGEADTSARHFQTSVARHAGWRVDVINLTAESGGAAGRAVQQAAPDGTTLLLARVGNLSVLPVLSPLTVPATADLTVLAVLDQAPLICFVRSAAPIASLRDLQAALADQPGRLRYSTGGAHSLQAIAARYLLQLSSLPQEVARPVPVSEGALVTQAVLTGEADFACNTPRSVLPQVEAGLLRPLLTTAQGRLKALPRLQNAAELGLRDLQHLQAWSALLGPPGMAADTVARWRALLDQVAGDADWVAATEGMGAAPRIRAITDPTQHLRQQAQFYQRLVARLGLLP